MLQRWQNGGRSPVEELRAAGEKVNTLSSLNWPHCGDMGEGEHCGEQTPSEQALPVGDISL